MYIKIMKFDCLDERTEKEVNDFTRSTDVNDIHIIHNNSEYIFVITYQERMKMTSLGGR